MISVGRNSCQYGLGGGHFEQVLAGGFDKLFDVHFDHFLVVFLAGLFCFHASHSRDGWRPRLWRKRGLEVTGFDPV